MEHIPIFPRGSYYVKFPHNCMAEWVGINMDKDDVLDYYAKFYDAITKNELYMINGFTTRDEYGCDYCYVKRDLEYYYCEECHCNMCISCFEKGVCRDHITHRRKSPLLFNCVHCNHRQWGPDLYRLSESGYPESAVCHRCIWAPPWDNQGYFLEGELFDYFGYGSLLDWMPVYMDTDSGAPAYILFNFNENSNDPRIALIYDFKAIFLTSKQIDQVLEIGPDLPTIMYRLNMLLKFNGEYIWDKPRWYRENRPTRK